MSTKSPSADEGRQFASELGSGAAREIAKSLRQALLLETMFPMPSEKAGMRTFE
jgi:hypothetical protein